MRERGEEERGKERERKNVAAVGSWLLANMFCRLKAPAFVRWAPDPA